MMSCKRAGGTRGLGCGERGGARTGDDSWHRSIEASCEKGWQWWPTMRYPTSAYGSNIPDQVKFMSLVFKTSGISVETQKLIKQGGTRITRWVIAAVNIKVIASYSKSKITSWRRSDSRCPIGHIAPSQLDWIEN